MILCVKSRENLTSTFNNLYTCPPHLYTVATLPWEIQKTHFQQCHSYIYKYFRLFSLSQKKTNCYSLTHHTWKMSPHYFVKCTTFSFDWRYVAFLQTLAALKSRLWVGIGGSEKNRLWYVANGMSGKQHYSKCSKWPPSARIAYMLPVFFATDQLHRPPRSAKIQLMSCLLYTSPSPRD